MWSTCERHLKCLVLTSPIRFGYYNDRRVQRFTKAGDNGRPINSLFELDELYFQTVLLVVSGDFVFCTTTAIRPTTAVYLTVDKTQQYIQQQLKRSNNPSVQ